jgi:deoxyadenosine/deoxycytidine kinase
LPRVDFRYLAIEGPIGLGKTALAERLGARLDANVVLDEAENPFLDDFYEGRAGAAFQSQLFFTLQRHRQQLSLRQGDLFSQAIVADYLFDRDRIYAFMNLDDNELFIYQRLFDLLARDLTAPDLVIYLQTPTDLLKKRIKERARRSDHRGAGPSDAYIAELNEAYNHFFFHYTATPLLVVETTQFDVSWGDDALDALLKQIQATSHGTRYYVPRT